EREYGQTDSREATARRTYTPAGTSPQRVLCFPFHSNGATTSDSFPLSLHDALPIFAIAAPQPVPRRCSRLQQDRRQTVPRQRSRSEEHTSELQSPDHLVCRLLLDQKQDAQFHLALRRGDLRPDHAVLPVERQSRRLA